MFPTNDAKLMKPKMYLVSMFLVSAMDDLLDLLSRQEESKGMSSPA